MPAAPIDALMGAHRGERRSHLIYRKPARNFGPIMAMGAKRTMVQASEIAGLGEPGREVIVTSAVCMARGAGEGTMSACLACRCASHRPIEPSYRAGLRP